MTGAEVLVVIHERHGVRSVFGNRGHLNTNVPDVIRGSDRISSKLVRHEQAADGEPTPEDPASFPGWAANQGCATRCESSHT